jgi:pyruvate-formate lyase-activating enzyme
LPEIASAYKVAYHHDKVEAYLRGERIYPACLELDLTAACNRNCALCPSTGSLASYSLSLALIERLFAALERQTHGLLLTGGEPTMAPTFGPALAQARARGFREIAVVTNGLLLHRPAVIKALLSHVSVVRVSLYDWTARSSMGAAPIFRRIEGLRRRVEQEGSALQIGISALTTSENAAGLAAITRQAADAGAHWIYFHPTCVHWDVGAPVRVSQEGVVETIEGLKRSVGNGFRVLTCADRYKENGMEFHGYHGSHFLLVVGADGINYLGAEVKYQARYAVSDLTGAWDSRFLWDKKRLAQIRGVESAAYAPLGSRHRGALYSNVLEELIAGRQSSNHLAWAKEENAFFYPHIL